MNPCGDRLARSRSCDAKTGRRFEYSWPWTANPSSKRSFNDARLAMEKAQGTLASNSCAVILGASSSRDDAALSALLGHKTSLLHKTLRGTIAIPLSPFPAMRHK
jgi:hypothetical protein